jgi:serine phosphatase RsbU (regulator of sigma subunit)
MLEQLDRERSYAASRAAARRGFAGQTRRQPREYLFGSYLTQALISELLVRQDRLLHQLRATTDALQRPLLPPSLPMLPGLDLAARYQPSGDGLHIGGDFYDAFPVSGGRWVLVLGDVCGKGPAAAAITGLVRHSLWAAAQQDPDAAHVLPLVNRALIREEGPYCTLVYAVVDPTRTPVRLQLVRAGHPAPLLRRADGTTSVLLTDSDFGLMLGAFDDVQHPVQQISLHPRDSLVLYTDGFTEGASCYKQRDSEDLAAILAACPVGTTGQAAGRAAGWAAGWAADLIAETLMEDACVWWSEQLRDDLAVLALTALSP